MKPGFALDLAQDGIRLLARRAEGWVELGHAAFAAEDFDQSLAMLRGMAETQAPGQVTTKLILPQSQILYTEVDAPGPDRAQRRSQIETALRGRTPYEVSDLVFDWSRIGPEVHVAVVARVTLDEA
ncbi:MAG: translation initiation factor 2, partial [Albidovulum sp.]